MQSPFSRHARSASISNSDDVSRPPLAGLRVLELARILAGPWAGQIFADLGADVIKIESSVGDDTRKWGPPFVTNPDGSVDAAYFHGCNRGKRSVVADFKSEQDRAMVTELAREADVIIENFKVGTLSKFGLDYATVSKLNSRVVYCSITGFGQTGPYAARPGYDMVSQAMSGLMDLTGEADGPPQKAGLPIADIVTGIYSAVAIQAALLERETSGIGQHIDMSLLDCITGILGNQAMNYIVSGVTPKRVGNGHTNVVPYDVFKCGDSWVVIAIGNDTQFQRFSELIGLDGIREDPRFATNANRLENRTALKSLIEDALVNRDAKAVEVLLTSNNIPAAPIHSVEQAVEDANTIARGMLVEAKRKEDGLALPCLRTPISFSRSGLRVDIASPLHGSAEAKWQSTE